MVPSGRNTTRWPFIPVSWAYGWVVGLRNMLYDGGVFRSQTFDLPVISVGNITVGGTGKTPHVEYLASMLSPRYRVATLSRGYLRKSRGFRLAKDLSTCSEIGDEPMQIHERFGKSPSGVLVAVDRKRPHGIRKLMELDPAVEVVLMDDAFQHRAVKPGLSILLVDYSRPLHRDHMLPAGTLREPAGNRKRADILVVTKTPRKTGSAELGELRKQLKVQNGQSLYFSTMMYESLIPVFPGEKRRSVEDYMDRDAAVLLVAGIANPDPLRTYARGLSQRREELLFPDHHRYSKKDAKRIDSVFRKLSSGGEVLVLTTEKDAVRLRYREFEPLLRSSMHAVRIRVEFLNNEKTAFDHQIEDYVRSNQRGSIPRQGSATVSS